MDRHVPFYLPNILPVDRRQSDKRMKDFKTVSYLFIMKISFFLLAGGTGWMNNKDKINKQANITISYRPNCYFFLKSGIGPEFHCAASLIIAASSPPPLINLSQTAAKHFSLWVRDWWSPKLGLSTVNLASTNHGTYYSCPKSSHRY